MSTSKRVSNRIDTYDPEGNLGQTAKVFLALYESQPKTKRHVESVALLSEAVAVKLSHDAKAAFFGGLLHDAGKIVLPSDLFDGHNIDKEEYERVKTHAIRGFEALKELHLFTALCAGLHHNLYNAGYGLAIKDFPQEWNLATVKKVLDISMIISICDFIDAYTHRKTKIQDGSDAHTDNLEEMLKEKYPNDILIIKTALAVGKIMRKNVHTNKK